MGFFQGVAFVVLGVTAGAHEGAAQTVEARLPVPTQKIQDRMATPRAIVSASVDEHGRVIPGGSAPADIQRIGGGQATGIPNGQRAESPCMPTASLKVEEARALVEEVARREQFLPDFVVSIAKTESAFDSAALSPRGAYGLMQLMPKTAQAYGVNICDPADNVRGGVAFLRDLTAKYRNPVYVLAAYNAGEPAVLKSRGVPPFAETVGYIAAVMNDYYQWPAAPNRTEPFMVTAPSAAAADRAQPQRAARSPTRTGHREAAGWAGGFVQNFD